MAFLKNLAITVTEKERRELFHPDQTFKQMHELCLKLARKYKLRVPASFEKTLYNNFVNPPKSAFGRAPKRISVYLYHHQIERIERLAEIQHFSKRFTFFQVINLGLKELEGYFGKMKKYGGK